MRYAKIIAWGQSCHYKVFALVVLLVKSVVSVIRCDVGHTMPGKDVVGSIPVIQK